METSLELMGLACSTSFLILNKALPTYSTYPETFGSPSDFPDLWGNVVNLEN
jgi:hypothetical protein